MPSTRPESNINKLLGVVLCGGRSTRMGRDKALLPHPGGGTFLQHAIDRLAKVCDDVVVSGKPSIDPGCLVIEDPVAHQGPATGVAAALMYAGENQYSACLITPVDTPLLTHRDVERLTDQWRTGGRLTLARSDRTEPLIGVYPTDLADQLGRLAASTDDRSLFRWIELQDHLTVSLPLRSCRNINTPQDVAKSFP